LMEVNKMQTRLEIERALPELVRNLQESGIQVKRVEVALTDQHESTDGGVFKDQAFATGREHWSGQQGSAGKDAQISDFNRSEANEWLTNANEYAEFAEPQGLITDKSINMLV